MTALVRDDRSRAARTVAGGVISALGLGLAVALRAEIVRTGALDGIAEGLLFGFALLAVALAAGLEPARPRLRAVAGGTAAGLALVAASVLARWPLTPLVLGHAASFWPWIAVTALVATAEELVLRGALWRSLELAAGDGTALLVTTGLFALMHVPVYGPAVVPLDLAAGLVLGGLRLWFGGPAAPAAAHVVADLATWWL